MRIAVIQLARLGDILQTLPTLAGLKARHPGCIIDLVVREKFIDAAMLSPHADRVIALPTKAIMEPLIRDGGKKEDPQRKALSLAHLITWVADQFLENTHKLGPYDMVINLTFSEASSYLCQLIPGMDRRGLKRAQDGAYAVDDPWSAYLYAQVLRKNMNIIHLNDLFARIAGVAVLPVEPATRGYDSSYNFGKLAIGLQLGASQSSKTLNPKAWGVLAEEILKALPEAQLVLFGSREDKKKAQALMATLSKDNKARCTSLVGRLRYSDIVPWVKRCHYMITPDTAMVHLAPLCGVKTINVSVGGVNPFETGPYGEGHYVLRPTDGGFDAGIPALAESVIDLIMGESAGIKVPCYRTHTVTLSDGTTRSALVPMNVAVNEIQNLFEQAYYLIAEFRGSGRLEDTPVPTIGSPDQPHYFADLKLAIDALDTTRKLAEFGRTYCMKMIENPGEKLLLQELGAKISEIESLYRNLHAAVPFVRPLLDAWEVAKENVLGDAIEELASLTESTFRELIQNIDMTNQLIQLALAAAEKRLDAGADAATPTAEPSATERGEESIT